MPRFRRRGRLERSIGARPRSVRALRRVGGAGPPSADIGAARESRGRVVRLSPVRDHISGSKTGMAGEKEPSRRGNSTWRPAATYASTASGHGHTMATGDTASDPSPRPWPNDGGEGSLTFQRGTPKILARPGTARQQHRQRAQPKTQQGCSGSQAVNTGRPATLTWGFRQL